MSEVSFYERVDARFSPGDFLEDIPFSRTRHPLKVARKPNVQVPNIRAFTGELREIFEVGKHNPTPPFRFSPPGEEALSNAKKTRALLLTWGSEIDSDLNSGKKNKKDWLVAPIFPLSDLNGQFAQGTRIEMPKAIRSGAVAKFFLVPSYPTDGQDYYVDFKRICYVAVPHIETQTRIWRFNGAAMNGFYHHLIWFFTRKKIFFEPPRCPRCGSTVDLNIVFESQKAAPEDPHDDDVA